MSWADIQLWRTHGCSLSRRRRRRRPFNLSGNNAVATRLRSFLRKRESSIPTREIDYMRFIFEVRLQKLLI